MKFVFALAAVIFLCAGCGLSFAPQTQSGDQQVDGQWKATEVKDVMGAVTRDCSDAFFRVDKSTSTLTITQREFKCAGGAYTVSYDALTLQIQDGRLLYQGREAGDFGDDYLEVDFNLTSTVNWRIKIRETGGKMRYTESLTGGSSTTALIRH